MNLENKKQARGPAKRYRYGMMPLVTISSSSVCNNASPGHLVTIIIVVCNNKAASSSSLPLKAYARKPPPFELTKGDSARQYKAVLCSMFFVISTPTSQRIVTNNAIDLLTYHVTTASDEQRSVTVNLSNSASSAYNPISEVLQLGLCVTGSCLLLHANSSTFDPSLHPSTIS